MKSYKLYTESKIDSIVATPTSLTIGKYAIVDGAEVIAYDYATNRTNPKIISTPTRKNIEQIERVCDDVIIDKIYKADLSKGRGAYSTFVSGSIQGISFMWMRRETRSTAAGQTLLYTPTTKMQGTDFTAALNGPQLFKVKGGGYKCVKKGPMFIEVAYGTQYTEECKTGFGELDSVIPPNYIIPDQYIHRDGNEPARLILAFKVPHKVIRYYVVNNGRLIYDLVLREHSSTSISTPQNAKKQNHIDIVPTKFGEFFDYLQRKEFS